MVPMPATLLSFSACTCDLMDNPLWSLTEKEKTFLICRWFCMIFRCHWKVESNRNASLSGTSLKDSSEGKLSKLAGLQAEYLTCSFCLGHEMAKCVIIYQFMCYGWNSEGTCLENWWQGNLGKRYMHKFVLMWKMWSFLCSMRILNQRLASAKEDFNNVVDRMICSVDTCQPLSPATPDIIQRTHEHSGHDGMDGG